MGHLGWLFKLNPHPRHQHCTDEAQKAETVLSAVIYIYIYTYINKTHTESGAEKSLFQFSLKMELKTPYFKFV